MLANSAMGNRTRVQRNRVSGKNCVTLPSELQVELRTIKDTNPQTHAKRLPDRHVVTVAVAKYKDGKAEPIVLRSFFFAIYSEAEKQYSCLINQLM